MTAEYFLASKSFLSIFLGCKTFRFTVPLILLMFPVHFGLPFPFSSSNHFKFPFLHKACLPWSNFHLLFFSLFFLFFFVFPHSSLIVSDSYSNLSTPTFQSISVSASHQQIRRHFSILLDTSPSTSVASFSFLSYSLNLKYLPLSTLFTSLWILFRQDPRKANSPKDCLQYKGKGVLILTYMYCFCSCLLQSTAAIVLKNLLKYQEWNMLK